MKSFKYTINGSVYKVHINSLVEDEAEVEVNGTPYNVTLEKPAKRQIIAGSAQPAASQPVASPRPAAPAAASAAAAAPKVAAPAAAAPAGAGALKSPLPGIILEVKCKVGDPVKRGQTLVVLEAMKMENNINADRDGSVVEVKVSKGDSVLENATLLIIG